MELNVESWKEFNLSRFQDHPGLFRIENCKCGSAGDLEDGCDINYIGAKKSDNGVMRKVRLQSKLVSAGNGIMFICDGEGSVGYANYMDKNFIGSTTTSIGYDELLNMYSALFIVTILDKEKFKFSYGRKYRAHINDIQIKLPVKHNSDDTIFVDSTCKYSGEGYVPDWKFMENYIKSLKHKPITTCNGWGYGLLTLGVEKWKEFLLKDLFDIVAGKYHYPSEYEAGNTRYVSASNENNGVAQKIDLVADFHGNAIVTGKVGCTAFYQPNDFCATSDVNVFYPKFAMNERIGLFIVTVINFNENYKWGYGRQCRVGDSNEITIKLPVADDGKPDWQFMDNYIKNLPYGDRI